jgi:alkylation response protein AidB-like acyl-CoA dehydrogenase
VDFSTVTLTEAQLKFRDEVRAFLDEHLTEEVYAGARERTDHFDKGLWLALGAKGWLQPRWKKEDGGAELDDVSVRILETELRKRDAPVAGGANDLIWPAVDAYGVPDLKAELKPKWLFDLSGYRSLPARRWVMRAIMAHKTMASWLSGRRS